MNLNDVHQGIQKRKARKRVGRGLGSGHGKTCGRGDKGHSSRSGHSYPLLFEGGQKRAMQRVAKRGFSNNYFAPELAILNLGTLDLRYQAGDVVDEARLRADGLVKGKVDGIKILGDGELTKALTIKAHRFSRSAEQKILAAGGATERVS